MIEYIPDLREVDLIPGLDISWRISSEPIPGFKDQFGNYVGVGDWVSMGANQGRCAGGLRLALVTKVEPKVTKIHDGYEPIPEAEWRPWQADLVAKGGEIPQRIKWTPGPLSVDLEVKFYFNANSDSHSRRHSPYLDQVARYHGAVPYGR